MYPLKALLVGRQNQTLADVRRELESLAIEIEAEVLDVERCVAHVSAHPCDRRLVIIDAGPPFDLAQMDRLSQAVAGRPMLALVNSDGDAAAVAASGSVEAARLPLQASDIRAALHRVAVRSAKSASPCRTVLVLGATEGSGCTTISLNLAAELARLQNHPCILGEQSVAFSRLANYLRIYPHLTIYDLVTELDDLDPAQMRKALTPIDDNLSVLVGSYLTIRPFTVTAEVAFKMLACALQLAETVIVDGRNNFDDIDFEFASKAQHLVLVGQPTVRSLNSLRTLLQSFASRECLAQRYVVINQYRPGDGVPSKRDFERHLNVPEVLLVASDPAAAQAAEIAGQTLRKAAPDSQALKDVTALARIILGMSPEPIAAPRRMGWRSLLRPLLKNI